MSRSDLVENKILPPPAVPLESSLESSTLDYHKHYSDESKGYKSSSRSHQASRTESDSQADSQLRELPRRGKRTLSSPSRQPAFVNNFESFKFTKIRVPRLRGQNRIGLSKNGKRMYFGGDNGLCILKRPNQNTVFYIDSENPDIKYFGLRVTPSGHVVLQEHLTHNLLIYNKKLVHQATFKGPDFDGKPDSSSDAEIESSAFRTLGKNDLDSSRSSHTQNRRRSSSRNARKAQKSQKLKLSKDGLSRPMINPHFSFENDKILWLASPQSIFIVDLRTLNQSCIMGLSSPRKESHFVTGIADFDKYKFFLCFDYKGKSLFVYKEGMKEQMVWNFAQVFEQNTELSRGRVYSMDVNREKKIGFIGGVAYKRDNYEKRQIGFLNAFNFSQ